MMQTHYVEDETGPCCRPLDCLTTAGTHVPAIDQSREAMF
jgi:hypothetical protein